MRQRQRTVQDDIREVSQASFFNLGLTQGRSNRFIPDADLVINGKSLSIELKTCNAASGKNQVSTARGVNISKISEWRKVDLWIFSKHVNNVLTGEHYVLTPKQMEDFFRSCEVKLHQGSKKLAGLNDWHAALKVLKDNNLDNATLEKLDYAFNHKGVALNDPKISWKYIMQNGQKVTSSAELKKIAKSQFKI